MRVAWVVALVLGGCGLTLDLDPPDPQVGIDGGARDAGPVDPCEGAADGTACGDGPPRICLGGLCVRSRCGDGFVDPRAGETCEDGNEISGDGCEPGICRYSCESDDDCSVTDPMCAAGVCTDAHGCSVALVPDETACTSAGSKAGECRAGICIPTTCGDGQLDADEACDDGNTEPGDGCEHDCSLICETDQDCSDGVECNGFEVCEREAYPDGSVRATCRSGRAAPIPACFDCNLLTGRLELIDADGDGYAPDDDPACEGRGGDCDDTDPRRHPGAPDFGPGDGVDNDCDGEIDEDRVATCYRDADGDGFGVPIESPGPVRPEVGCPDGTIPVPHDMSVRVDCDDDDPDVFPGQTAWFATSRCADGTAPPGALCWDYDCDGVETVRWPRAEACLTLLGRCDDQGWSLGDGLVIPTCGESGTWATCANLGLACLPHLSGTPLAQECR